jgi:hypothetical protein
MKATQLLRAQHAEKAAHLKTLTLADNQDSKAINKTIDEMMALKGEILKQGISFKQAFKEILTPDQLKDFQSRMLNMRHHRGGMGFDRGQMMGGQKGVLQFGRGQMPGAQRGIARNYMPGRAQMDIRFHKEAGSVKPDTSIVK